MKDTKSMTNIDRMLIRLPVVYDWIYYEGERVFVAINYEATKKAKRPMVDIHYCATAALNNRVEKTVQWNKNKFKLI